MASSASGHACINSVNVKKTWTSNHISLHFLCVLPVISDNVSGRNRLLHFDSSIPCKLDIVWGLALFKALSPHWHTSVHKAQHYCISKPEQSDLFAGITETSPNLLNRVEELICRGGKQPSSKSKSNPPLQGTSRVLKHFVEVWYSNLATMSECFGFTCHGAEGSVLLAGRYAPSDFLVCIPFTPVLQYLTP